MPTASRREIRERTQVTLLVMVLCLYLWFSTSPSWSINLKHMHAYNHKSESLLTHLWSLRRGDGVESTASLLHIHDFVLQRTSDTWRTGVQKQTHKETHQGSNMHSSASNHSGEESICIPGEYFNLCPSEREKKHIHVVSGIKPKSTKKKGVLFLSPSERCARL